MSSYARGSGGGRVVAEEVLSSDARGSALLIYSVTHAEP